MRVLDPGHRYVLSNLTGGGETEIHFEKDPALHDGDGYCGPICQEYLRAILDRVHELNRERADIENDLIIYHGRMMIAAFEARAIRRRVEKDGLAIEHVPVAEDGHVLFASADAHPKDGDSTQIEAPLVSGAVPKGDAQ